MLSDAKPNSDSNDVDSNKQPHQGTDAFADSIA